MNNVLTGKITIKTYNINETSVTHVDRTKLIWVTSNVITKKCYFFAKFERSNLVLAVFENVALSETAIKQPQHFEKNFTSKFQPNSGRFACFGQIQLYFQTQLFADNLQNRCLKNFAIFTGKHLCWSFLLITL